jgi:hypothetical protein
LLKIYFQQSRLCVTLHGKYYFCWPAVDVLFYRVDLPPNPMNWTEDYIGNILSLNDVYSLQQSSLHEFQVFTPKDSSTFHAPNPPNGMRECCTHNFSHKSHMAVRSFCAPCRCLTEWYIKLMPQRKQKTFATTVENHVRFSRTCILVIYACLSSREQIISWWPDI